MQTYKFSSSLFFILLLVFGINLETTSFTLGIDIFSQFRIPNVMKIYFDALYQRLTQIFAFMTESAF